MHRCGNITPTLWGAGATAGYVGGGSSLPTPGPSSYDCCFSEGTSALWGEGSVSRGGTTAKDDFILLSDISDAED